MAVYSIKGAERTKVTTKHSYVTFWKVWRGGEWRWVGPRLPYDKYHRAAVEYGDVETGELVVQFSNDWMGRPCTIDWFARVTDELDDDGTHLTGLDFERPSLAKYRVDGIEVPNPIESKF